MALTERHHAFISAAFFRELKMSGVNNYTEIFQFATRKYAEERGARMAMRALRDGQPLDFSTYGQYGEWAYSPEFLARDGEFVETFEREGDRCLKVFACPWSEQYIEMGLLDGAQAYCAVLDASIARGFDPALKYTVEHTMHAARDFCLHCMHGAANAQPGERNPEDIRDFDFHCSHIYTTFDKIIHSITRLDLGARVLAQFEREYGADALSALKAGLSQDFHSI